LPEKILVTGASGFLGQWVLAGLLEISKDNPGITIRCETNHSSEMQQTLFPYFKETTTYTKDLKEFDLIFDLQLPSTGTSISEQISQAQNFYLNVSRNAMRTSRGGRLIHPSSGAVYGNLRYSETLCESLEIFPKELTIYGETKRGIESLSDVFATQELDFVTPRIFSVFGPLMRKDSPLIGNTFIREASKGNKISAQISKNVFRDFCYVTDLVKQLIYLGVAGSKVKNINLGSGNVAEISHFGSTIAEFAKVLFEPGESSEKADKYFGCLHELCRLEAFVKLDVISIEEAVARTLSFYKEKQ
jgi:nucleoside-diphosphate-sugar epimerase